MDDAELAGEFTDAHQWPGIEILDADDGMPQVRITDGALELAPKCRSSCSPTLPGAMEALQAGASAVLSECVDGDTLCIAIRAAAQGLTTLSAEFRDHLVDSSGFRGALEGDAEDEPPPIRLTARELQVLRLLAEGASNKSIARRLDITPHSQVPRRLPRGKIGRYGADRCGGQSHAFGARHDLKSGAADPSAPLAAQARIRKVTAAATCPPVLVAKNGNVQPQTLSATSQTSRSFATCCSCVQLVAHDRCPETALRAQC